MHVLLVVLIVLSFAAYPFADLRMEIAGIRVPYSTVLLPPLLLTCLLRLLFRRRQKGYSPGLILASAGLFLSMLLPVCLGASPDWEWMLRYGMFFLTPLLFTLALETASHLRLAILLLLVVGVFFAGYGYYLFFEKNLGYYDLHYTEATRNGDAALMSAFVLLSLAYAFWGQRGKLRLAASLTLVAAFGAGVLLSFSRGVWLGVTAGALSLLYFRSRRWHGKLPHGRRYAVLGVLVATAILAIPQDTWLQLGGRFASITSLQDNREVSNRERVRLYGSAVEILLWEGWTGTGVRDFGAALRKRTPHLRLQHAHNGYLNIWAEQGLLGLASYLALTLYPAWVLKRHLLLRPWTPQTWMFSGLLAIAIAWFICSLFDTLYFGFFYWMVYGMITCAALLARQAANQCEPRMNANQRE